MQFLTRTRKPVYIALSLISFSLLSFLSGCDNDDPEPVNENELITTLNISFRKIEQDGQAVEEEPVEFSWQDSDGPGPLSPVVDEITLDQNARYEMILTVLDESKTPADNITEEIREEDEEHQFFFVVTGINATATYDEQDIDDDGNPVGLENYFETGAAGSGSLRVILRHEPNKDAAGVADGDPQNAGGDTDLDVTFDVTVQ